MKFGDDSFRRRLESETAVWRFFHMWDLIVNALKEALRKLFKNPRCQAGWNKNVLFGFS